MTCAAVSHCEKGACVDDCAGVVCPTKRVCKPVSVNGRPARGTCVDLCHPDPCPFGYACQWQTGACVGIPIADEGGLILPPALGSPGDLTDVAGSGWLCSAQAFARASAFGALLGAALAAAFVLRRRRRPR